MPTAEEARIVPVFKVLPIKNEGMSKQAGRPIYEDVEICEIRFAGDRQRVGHFPALASAGYAMGEDGYEREVTYAEKYSDQYRRFKAEHQQIAVGTPVDELTFLSAGKKAELRALNIHTAEALAALDGNELRSLGMGGRQLKDQATAYLAVANGTANATHLAADNVSLKQQLADMREELAKSRSVAAAQVAANPLNSKTDDELKALIKEKTGQAPRGQPSHETLVRMAIEVSDKEAA